MPGNRFSATEIVRNTPANGYSSLGFRRASGELGIAVSDALAALRNAKPVEADPETLSSDPETRLEQEFAQLMATVDNPPENAATPVLIVVSGDVASADAFALLEREFGALPAGATGIRTASPIGSGERRANLGVSVAQAQLGYIVAAPGPREEDYSAVRILQYILAHGYEGRLGVEAISKQGLAYYIDSRYRSDGFNGWVTLGIGVDPHKVAALKTLLLDQLQQLEGTPPTVVEFEEAKSYLLGRAASSSQSNQELAEALARQWLWHGDAQIKSTLEERLAAVSYRDVLDAVPAFVDGLTLEIVE
jgi:predicted Zn-dependent peptidase